MKNPRGEENILKCAFNPIVESLRNTTRLLMTSQRSLETSAIFRFEQKLYFDTKL